MAVRRRIRRLFLGHEERHAGESVRSLSLMKRRDELEPSVIDEAMPIMGGLLHELGYLSAGERDEMLANSR